MFPPTSEGRIPSYDRFFWETPGVGGGRDESIKGREGEKMY